MLGCRCGSNSWGGSPAASSETVSYTSVNTALPEPSSLALLGTALLIVTLKKASGGAWARGAWPGANRKYRPSVRHPGTTPFSIHQL